MNLQRLTNTLCVLTVSLILPGCGSKPGTEGGSTSAPTIATQPANQTVTAGQTANFLCGGRRNRTFDLPVAEGHDRNHRGNVAKLYDTRNNNV